MSPIPVLMVLYSSDAVEIRYSDGSRLELSPCGSAVIHHDAPNKVKHPRHDLSRKAQKRTQFVTSEHRHKVLQALDFRNRFAERPYLCEDLLPKEDILALYAHIDRVTWPKQPEKAKVEVLPDGSRRITSLDEFASLVVSPHGHDFTVCYLSRLSEDQGKPKGSLSSTSCSMNSSPPVRPMQVQGGDILTQSSGQGTKFEFSPKKAIVRPLEMSDTQNVPTGHPQSSLDFIHPQHDRNMKKVNSQMQGLNIRDSKTTYERNADNGRSNSQRDQQQEQVFSQFQASNKNSELGDQLVYAHGISHQERQNAQFQNTGPGSASTSPSQHADSTRNKQYHDPAIPFATNSPNSHEISSISRSSSPDGLRTTIDSDATLLHDNVTDTSLSKVVVNKQRHSSPTHYTSSPYENQVEPNPKKQEKRDDNDNISLSGSFLGNQKYCSPGKQSFQDGDEEFVEPKEKSSSSSAKNNSCSMSADSLELQHTLVEHSPQSLYQLQLKRPSNTENDNDTCIGADHPSDKVQMDIVQENDAQCPKFVLPQEQSGHSNKALSTLTEKSSGLFEFVKEEGKAERQCRQRYMWTTKHASCNECPTVWTHPLKLALEGTSLAHESLSAHPTLQRLQAMSTSFKASERKCIFSVVPCPLPLTCPFHHIHKWSSSHRHDDTTDEASNTNAGEFQHGRLKIVISEGVVYRLIHRADMKVMEIHPGDGSVLVSQGVKGHFFTHCILVGDQLEERTYCLKSLPPSQLKGKYSIEKLIKTANRFLVMNEKWERRGLKEDIPCWKREVVAVVEPLSSSLLEECVVEGLGKFSAFTNGRMRIVFEDRAALDMMCSFSRRVSECLQHSQDPHISMPCASTVGPPVPTMESIFGASSGRLLLPSGKYVTVNINNPGPYRRYIQAAQEWASWVNSTPMERQQFYSQHHIPSVLKQAAEIELKKIFCFNYILEQTTLMQQHHQENSSVSNPPHHSTGAWNLHHDWSSPFPAAPTVHSGEDMVTSHYISSYCPQSSHDQIAHRSKLMHSAVQRGPYEVQHPSQDPSSLQSSCQQKTVVSQRIPPVSSGWTTSSDKQQETLQGFQMLRQVLLQNSNLINDIDSFLESTRKS